MKVTIKTTFGNMAFDMSEENATKLIQAGMVYADEYKTGQDAPKEVPAQAPEAPKAAPVRRTERLFGTRTEWDMPAAKTQPAKIGKPEGYWGFLYIRCGGCGQERGFNVREPITDARCQCCGMRTELKDMRLAFVHCRCGGSFTYRTNIKDYGFTMECLNCKNEVPLVLNERGTDYITVGRNLVSIM